MKINYAVFTETTRSNMIADISHYLAESYDTIPSAEYDAAKKTMKEIFRSLSLDVGDEIDGYLYESGADPEIVYS